MCKCSVTILFSFFQSPALHLNECLYGQRCVLCHEKSTRHVRHWSALPACTVWKARSHTGNNCISNSRQASSLLVPHSQRQTYGQSILCSVAHLTSFPHSCPGSLGQGPPPMQQSCSSCLHAWF